MDMDARLLLDRIAMGERILRARISAGVSMTDFAKSLTITAESAIALERGRRRIDAKELRLISRIFSVRIEYLLGMESLDSNKPSPRSVATESQAGAAEAQAAK